MDIKKSLYSPRARRLCGGFSLVELSIVLVILGLLVGGVLAGKSLIRAAQLRKISSEEQSFVAAVQSFKGKYFYLPGDLPNATQFWGALTGCYVHSSPPSTNTKTCNGDGNGLVDANTDEENRIWQHLANAGLITGQYPGNVSYSGPTNQVSGRNWWFRDFGVVSAANMANAWFYGYYSNSFWLLGSGTGDYLTPQELYNIDTKTDDGKPATGKLVGFSDNTDTDVYDLSNCTTTSNSTVLTADYKLSSDTIGCQALYRTQF